MNYALSLCGRDKEFEGFVVVVVVLNFVSHLVLNASAGLRVTLAPFCS